MSEPLDLVVAERRQETADIVSLVLRRSDGAPLPAWEPGAHVDLILSDSLERQYSLCGGDARSWRIAVLREQEGRGGSAHVHRELGVGSRLHVRGPRNRFRLEPAPSYRFVAGGIGITPILPMLKAATSKAATGDWSLYYGGRSRQSMAFTEELAADHPADRIRLCEGPLDLPEFLSGLRPGELVYACGPESLLTAVAAIVPPEALRTERFSAPQAGTTGNTVGNTAGNTPFEVELARSGRTLTVAADQSILATLQRAGVEVLYSCTEGTCGTCETDVLSGKVDHRDSVLTPQERACGDTLMVCVSRAKEGRLTLDL
ncbi:PDR/VanB family oxidoreductase [Streptomyces sp. NPDC050147]|uniref:PDR/VanB family oxidoreductase n=1 Tax=Streptomyces sp. NPDC050147 TaxID=3155513 RepID=UPI003448C463